MNNITVIGNIIKINLKKYKIIDCIVEKEEILEFWISGKNKYCICPQCGLKTNKRQDLKEYKQKKNLKHIILSDNRIIEIKPIKRFFRCLNCRSKFLEKFEFESNFGLHTNDFEDYVISSWGYLSGPKIVELSHSKIGRIYGILKKIDHTKLNENGMKILEELDKIYLGVDEHSFSGKDMVLIITELKTKKLIAVLDGITKEKLDSWIWSIPLKIQTKIKGFSTDMNKGYKKSLEQIISKPSFSVDKYHLFQEANRMIDDVRQLNIWLVRMNFIKINDLIKIGKIPKKISKKEIQEINNKSNNLCRMKKYKNKVDMKLKPELFEKIVIKNKHGEIVNYTEITQEYYEEKGYRTLFLKREKNLSPIQKIRLSQIFRDFDYNGYLAEAQNIKEDFMNAVDSRDINKIKEIMLECKDSEHHRLKQFARTINNWFDGIEGYCKYSTEEFKFTNAYTEGFNHICKNLKRQAHGFKLKENYIKKY